MMTMQNFARLEGRIGKLFGSEVIPGQGLKTAFLLVVESSPNILENSVWRKKTQDEKDATARCFNIRLFRKQAELFERFELGVGAYLAVEGYLQPYKDKEGVIRLGAVWEIFRDYSMLGRNRSSYQGGLDTKADLNRSNYQYGTDTKADLNRSNYQYGTGTKADLTKPDYYDKDELDSKADLTKPDYYDGDELDAIGDFL